MSDPSPPPRTRAHAAWASGMALVLAILAIALDAPRSAREALEGPRAADPARTATNPAAVAPPSPVERQSPTAVQAAPQPARNHEVYLVGELTGAGRPLDSPIEVLVNRRDGSGPMIRGSAPGDGPYRVELSPLFDDAHDLTGDLNVRFSHPELFTTDSTLVIDPRLFLGASDAPRELRLDAHLDAGSGLRGFVELPDGAPAAGAPMTFVKLDGSDSSRRCVCDSGGAFSFKTRWTGACQVVAETHGQEPISTVAELHVGQFAHIGALRFEGGGSEIRGRVLLPDACGAQRVRVRAFLLSAGLGFSGSSQTLWRSSDDELRSIVQDAWADPSGEFVISGLEAGQGYSVKLAELVGCDVLPILDPARVTAPADGLMFGEEGALLTIQVVEEERPVDGARVGLERQIGGHYARSNEAGRARFLVDAAEDYRAVAARPESERAERELPAAGRAANALVTLELRSRAWQLTTLVIELELAQGVEMSEPHVYLNGSDPSRMRLLDDLDDGVPVRFKRRGDSLLLDRLNPGTYWVTVEDAAGPRGFELPGHYLPTSFSAQLEAGGVHHERITPVLGGVVHVRLDGTARRDLQALTELRDEGGKPIPAGFIAHEQRGEDTGYSQGPCLLPGLNNVLQSALAPGQYELRATLEGHSCSPTHFTVTPGSTQELVVHVTPE